jgi:AcrR family transcriptional regulator
MEQRQRRTQAERVDQTRTALLDATIELLAEVGYAATTTREVAQRAGVSRGAQTHHFPAKSDLVAAAIDHLFATQAVAFRRAFDEVPPERRSLATAIDILWTIVKGRPFAAVLEVYVAARTDDELRVVVQALAISLEATIRDIFLELFPGIAGDERVASVLGDIAFSLLQGAALSAHAGFGEPERTIRLLKSAAALITPATVGLVHGAIDALDP